MREVARLPLAGGGVLLVESRPDTEGPMNVGRVGEALRDLPRTLQDALKPVGDAAQAVLEQLRRAGPEEVEVQFGLDLSAETGIVVTKSQAAFHLQVRVLWKRDEPTG